jgi:hypothetical protein
VIRQRRKRRLKRRTFRRLGEDREKIPEQNRAGDGTAEKTDDLKKFQKLQIRFFSLAISNFFNFYYNLANI